MAREPAFSLAPVAITVRQCLMPKRMPLHDAEKESLYLALDRHRDGELDMESLGTARFGEQVSLRRVLVGMVEETDRHAGHMDILPELLDGATGSHPDEQPERG
jgi:hypothetical protein